MKSRTILIMNADAKYASRVRDMLADVLTQGERSEGYPSGMKITIGVGSAVDSLGDIRKSYQQAQNAIRARIVTGTGKLIDSEKLPPIEGRISSTSATGRNSPSASISSIGTP